MNIFDVETAVFKAEKTQKAVDRNTRAMATMLKGRLRTINVNGHHANHKLLADLKKELSQFNAKTGQWR